jgi:hypothetical protein
MVLPVVTVTCMRKLYKTWSTAVTGLLCYLLVTLAFISEHGMAFMDKATQLGLACAFNTP